MKNTRKIFLLLSFMMVSCCGFSQIIITFTVDVTGFPVYPGGVHIAGQFASTNCSSITEEWQPAAPGSLMTLLYDSTYGIDVTFPESSIGYPFEWEFVRDSVWGNVYEDPSEGNWGDPTNLFNDSCASVLLDNRLIIIPSECSIYNAVWNKCAFLQPSPCDTLAFASETNVCEKFCIDFTDQSTNNPTSWQWIFEGANPPTSTDQNPMNICYDVPGNYDVTLITTDAGGNDTLTMANYIHVNPTPPIPVITQNDNTLTSTLAAYYQWQLNTIDIPGATNQSYEVQQTGFYTVVVSNENGCDNSTTIYVELTGIENISNDQNISISPNPAQDHLTIAMSTQANENATAIIAITDVLGKKMLQQEFQITHGKLSKEILLSKEFTSGSYFVQIRMGDSVFTQELIVQR